MTVAEMIEQLQKMPAHMEVRIHVEGASMCEDCYAMYAGWSPMWSITNDNIPELGNICSIEGESL